MRHGIQDIMERETTFSRIMRQPFFLSSNKHLLLGYQRKPSDLRLLDIGRTCIDGSKISEFALDFTE
jgi:hypothetical protein